MVAFTFSDPAFLRPPAAPPSGGVAPDFIGMSTVSGFGGTHNHTAPASLASGQKYVVLAAWTGDAAAVTMTVNGTSATGRGSEFENTGVSTRIFDVTPGSSGTSVSLSAGSGNFALESIIAIVEVANDATFEAVVTDVGTVDNVADVSLNVGANDSLLALATGANATGVTWVGATQAGSATESPIFASCAIAEDVSAATPRTVTGTRVGTTDTNDGFVGVLARYSA